MSTALVIAIAYFFFLSVGVSFFLRKKVKSGSDFVTGSAKLAWPLVTAAFVLAPLGSGHTLSLWEASAGMGASVLWWGMISGGIFVPLFLLWFGPWFRRLNVKTFPEGMGKIFGEKIGWLISAVFPAQLIGICIAEVTATATAFYALGGGNEGNLGIMSNFIKSFVNDLNFIPGFFKAAVNNLESIHICIVLAVVFTILYIVAAGLMQVAWMNLFNAIMLVCGSFVAVFYTGSWLADKGGWGSVADKYAGLGEAWKTSILNFSPDVVFGIMFPCLILLVFMCSASQAQCQPMLLARSESDIRRGVFWASFVNSMVTYPWVILALVGMVVVPNIASLSDPAKLSVPELAIKALPPWMVGILMIALLSATLSTTSILILASSHIIVHDIFKGVVNPKMRDKSFLWLTRMMIFICAVLVIIPALKLTLMLPIFFWTFSFAIPVFGVYLIGMLWKVNRIAAWTTILAGYAASFLWTFAAPDWLPDQLSGNAQGVYATTIATVIFGVVLNLILPGDPPYIRKLKAGVQATDTAA